MSQYSVNRRTQFLKRKASRAGIGPTSYRLFVQGVKVFKFYNGPDNRSHKMKGRRAGYDASQSTVYYKTVFKTKAAVWEISFSELLLGVVQLLSL